MKTVEYYWDHPLLNAYRREIKKGTFLFRRGDPVNTFFIIQQGLVQLVGHRSGRDYYLNVVEAGQFLGERMVYSCAYFNRPDATLDQAQSAKLEHICRKLRLQPGETLAGNYPSVATAYMLTDESVSMVPVPAYHSAGLTRMMLSQITASRLSDITAPSPTGSTLAWSRTWLNRAPNTTSC